MEQFLNCFWRTSQNGCYLCDKIGPFRVFSELKLEAEVADVGNSVSEISVAVDGPEQKLFLSVKSLAAYLRVLQAPQIAIELISATKMVVFKLINSADYVYALMPTLPRATPEVQTSL